ncbi:MAG: 2-hydroxyacyl-CoA dehydratase [Dehalococcoidia bacterium]|nr:2-hydroxyacyl-CoA dehydratase [Dehalococcoidia bacterium]
MQNVNKSVGITTTVPVEVMIAAGYTPIDLNNIFISDEHPERLVRTAERAGFPLNTCAWIKGIYAVVLERGIDAVLGVTTGDCSNTAMLMEVLGTRGVKTIPFPYPDHPDTALMQAALERLADDMGTTTAEAERVKEALSPARNAVHELDRLTWQENTISGFENHYWLVSGSDFNRDTEKYQSDIETLIAEAKKRPAYPASELRLGYIGVPSVYGRELYPFLEQNGARVVYNEIQRQFAMPEHGRPLAEQYTRYTYPYDIVGRIRDIKSEIEKRSIDGIIHYVQAFCHRAIGDIVLRQRLGVPVLTIEGNAEFGLTQHLKTRLEAFVDMLAQLKQRARQDSSGDAPVNGEMPASPHLRGK